MVRNTIMLGEEVLIGDIPRLMSEFISDIDGAAFQPRREKDKGGRFLVDVMTEDLAGMDEIFTRVINRW